MKANQAFRENDEAVSPVIGVILMVAITVVLAAVVFVLVTKLSGNNSQNTPSMSFNPDISAKKVTVVSAAATADWKDIKVTLTDSAAACVLKLNGAGSTIATATAVKATTTPVVATDYLVFTGGAAGEICTLTLIYTPSNTQLGSTWSFTF